MKLAQQLATRPWLIAVAIVAAALLWMLSGYTDEGGTPADATPPAAAHAATPKVQVRTQHAEQVMRYVTVRGSTAPARRVELKAETNGRVVAIGARRGESVKAGTAIAQLDQRDRTARLEEARAAVRQWETNYAGQLELKVQGYVSETHLAETLASLERARAELTRAELDLQYMTVRAPFDGVLQERLVEVGDFVQSGDPIAVFVEVDPLIVAGNVAETDLAKLAVGAAGQGRLATGQEVDGRIRYLSSVADTATRTFRMELEVPNPQAKLAAGVTAEIRIPVGAVWAQRVSPALLTLDDDGDVGIKIVDPDGTVGFYPADISMSSDDGVWIVGLPARAAIITAGQGFVKPGDTVEAVFERREGAALASGRD